MSQPATVSVQPPDTFSIYSYNNQKPGMYVDTNYCTKSPLYTMSTMNHPLEIRRLCSGEMLQNFWSTKTGFHYVLLPYQLDCSSPTLEYSPR